MKNAISCVGLLMLFCMLPARAVDVREQGYSVGVNVDAQGRVTACDPDDGSPGRVPTQIAKVIDAAVQQWRFAPARIGGKAVPAHTFVHVKLRATPNAKGGYDLRISYVGNGPRLERHGVIPTYPADAIRMRESAFVYLDVTVQPDGSLTDAKVTSQFESWKVRPSFKKSALEMVKQWRAVPERVNGQPVATHLRVPITYALSPPEFTARQVLMLRAQALKEDAANDGPGISLPSQQEVALDSPLQPQSVAAIVGAP